jgi:hypothetical protein
MHTVLTTIVSTRNMTNMAMDPDHRYLMTRLSLPQLSLHRRAALSTNSNGIRSYIAERTQNAVYIVRCL